MLGWAALVTTLMAGQGYPLWLPGLINMGGPTGSQGGCPANMPGCGQAWADTCSWRAAERWLSRPHTRLGQGEEEGQHTCFQSAAELCY